jgi:outer membrane protein OmpA-like peptidoglycan-associated protein
MTPRRVLIAALLSLSLTATFTHASSPASEQVNSLFQEARKIMLQGDSHFQTLAHAFSRNRKAAEEMLLVLGKRAESSGKQGEAFAAMYERVGDVLLLTQEEATCSDALKARLVQIADKRRLSEDDILFTAENAARLCPDDAADVFPALAAGYLRQGRFGAALDASARGAKASDSVQRQAARLAKLYANGKALSEDEWKALLEGPGLGSREGGYVKSLGLSYVYPHRAAQGVYRILFDERSVESEEDFEQQLQVFGKAVKRVLDHDMRIRVVIEGHSDARGNLKSNIELAQKRAEAVKDRLVKRFRVDGSRIDVVGHGPWRPYTPSKDASGLAMNRRVQFKIVYE